MTSNLELAAAAATGSDAGPTVLLTPGPWTERPWYPTWPGAEPGFLLFLECEMDCAWNGNPQGEKALAGALMRALTLGRAQLDALGLNDVRVSGLPPTLRKSADWGRHPVKISLLVRVS